MEPPTEHEKNKQRRIYKWCMAVFALEGILIAALVCVLTFFPKDRALHNVVGFTFIGSFVPALIAVCMMSRVRTTRHVEAGEYSLPYKLGKEKVSLIIPGGIMLLLSLLMMPTALSGRTFTMTEYKGGPAIFSVPSWILPLFLWGPFGPLLLLTTWQGVILFDDHLCHYTGWKKHNMFYRDMKRVEIKRRGATYVMEIHHEKVGKPPLEIHLTMIPAKDCAIMLNVIQKFSPDAVMNELAQQMRQGEFPLP